MGIAVLGVPKSLGDFNERGYGYELITRDTEILRHHISLIDQEPKYTLDDIIKFIEDHYDATHNVVLLGGIGNKFSGAEIIKPE